MVSYSLTNFFLDFVLLAGLCELWALQIFWNRRNNWIGTYTSNHLYAGWTLKVFQKLSKKVDIGAFAEHMYARKIMGTNAVKPGKVTYEVYSFFFVINNIYDDHENLKPNRANMPHKWFFPYFQYIIHNPTTIIYTITPKSDKSTGALLNFFFYKKEVHISLKVWEGPKKRHKLHPQFINFIFTLISFLCKTFIDVNLVPLSWPKNSNRTKN